MSCGHLRKPVSELKAMRVSGRTYHAVSIKSKAAVQRCLTKKAFLKISERFQENTRGGVLL